MKLTFTNPPTFAHCEVWTSRDRQKIFRVVPTRNGPFCSASKTDKNSLLSSEAFYAIDRVIVLSKKDTEIYPMKAKLRAEEGRNTVCVCTKMLPGENNTFRVELDEKNKP